ncbi:uvrD/REP helicase [Fusobacterium sp. CAG:439]|nr:uvrD/REP helicase [Fusobacterium sp. CAG:439]
MLFCADLSTNKTDFLINAYLGLLNSGVKSSEILVLVQNSSLKQNFINKTLEKLEVNCIEKLEVHSFFSLVYNTINDNWALIENINPFNNPAILPNLAGLEVSQFILKDILHEVPFKGYNSKKSLLHQIFRRYSLIVQNNLTDEEVEWRSRILGESFAEDAKNVLKKLLSKTLALRDFDYLRQVLVFNYVYKNSDYFKNIKYLILDDGDEITPVCFDFISYLAPQLNDVFIAFDEKGASRTGYLSADRTAVWKFEELFNQNAEKITSENRLAKDAETLFSNITKNKTDTLENFSLQSPSKRASMIDEAIKQIKELLAKNVLPSEISIITPVIDDMLKFSLKENIHTNLMFLSGSEKLIQNRLVKAVLTILKLNSGIKLSEFDLRVVLSEFLGIPVKYCRDILENFEKNGELAEHEFKLEEYTEKYKKFLDVIKKLSESSGKLSEKVYDIYYELAEFYYVNPVELNKFNFFVKQLQDFENIFGKDFETRKNEIINQIENSIIAENPYSTLEIAENDLVISTPQKIIDNQIKSKYQFWLDISSDEWIKSDTGPLYNAWVFQRGWAKDEFTIDDNIELSKEKTARILRKLTLCASGHVYTYSSLFDGNGIENFGGIEEYIKIKEQIHTEETKKAFKIIPRDDQKPVLEYETGKMAISAVPGAGKTTILLALILKLLDNGVNPENIFVMTYMESAARNFRDRIKNIRQNSSQLPNISTIHGLALRILKENGNFERLGLSSDFEICDDTQRSRIIREIANKLKLKKTETDEFDRGISVFKIGNGQFQSGMDKKLEKFQIFFEEYQRILKEANLIDYDDMLTSSVKLLEDNADIRAYYQDICHYIIEDEAQDSSSIQQRLINLLSAKHKNLIRCGDINQAITTTFSNADVEGFRKFISESNNVSMNCSQRCTKDVWTLANNLVKWADTQQETKNAFFEIFMQPVEGRNPVSENALHAVIFEKPLEERNYILKEIKSALKKNPKCTIGILLRSNYQVAQWINFINNSGLKSITRSESLEQKSIFRTIFAVMQMILHPFDNNVIADNYEILAEMGLYKQRLGLEIRKYENPFIQIDCDNIENIYLAQFYWDLTYWLSFPHLAAEELAIKIGLHYFNSEIEKSNVYLISTLIKRLSLNYKDFPTLIERLGELAKKPSLSGFKFFSEEDESDKEFLAGKVQIMTLHKSKGDEFDYVFIPEMAEKNLTLDFEQIKLKNSDFNENLKRLNPDYKPKTEFDMKQELVSENLRLLYVAITRAKKHLYFSTSRKVKSFEKIIEQEPSLIFTDILDCTEVCDE